MATKVTVRPLNGVREIEEGVGKLRVTAYPNHPEVRDFDFYTSVYRWYEQHPLADQVHRWAAITPEGEVVGHLSAFPQYYRINGRRVAAHTPADYMVHPDYGFYALSLMRKFFRACENCVACDLVPAVVSVEERLGAEVAGQLRNAAKVLDVSRFPKPVPAPLHRPLNAGLRVADEALGRVFGGGPEVEEVEEFDDAFDALFERVAAAVPCIPEKDAAFLRWRYGPGSPQHPVTVLGVKGGAGLLGYAVLKITRGMDGYILDLTALPGRPDVSRALLRAAVRRFRRAGAQIVRYRYGESPASARPDEMWRLGFFHRRVRRNNLLVKLEDPGLQKTARRVSNWAYTLGDGEGSFWMV